MQKFEFAEMNIVHRGNPNQTLSIVRRAIRMGYDAVVLNIDIGSSLSNNVLNEETKVGDNSEPPRKKMKKQKAKEPKQTVSTAIPDPFVINEADLDLSSFESSGKRFRQFSRLTVTLDMESVHKLQHEPKVKLFDIVAVRVPDEQLLLTLQRKGDFVDLVTLDSISAEVGRIPWLYKQKIVQSCISSGIFFEICYSHALESSESRRQFFAHSHKLMEITRGNGVVISSGTSEMISLRAPYDVANLSILFGASSKKGKKFISDNPHDVLLRSQTRRTKRGAIHIVDLGGPKPTIPSNSNQKTDALLQDLAEIDEFRNELKEK